MQNITPGYIARYYGILVMAKRKGALEILALHTNFDLLLIIIDYYCHTWQLVESRCVD